MPGYSTGYGQGEKYNPKVHLAAAGAVALHAARIAWVGEHVQTVNELTDPLQAAEAKVALYETVLDWLASGDVADPISLASSTLDAADRDTWTREGTPAESEPDSYGGY